MNRSSWLALWTLSIGWGTVGVGTRAAFESDVGSLTVVAGRLTIAAAAVVTIQLFVRGKVIWRREVVRTGAVMAVVGVAAPFVLFNSAYHHASAGFVGLMAALSPLGTAVFAHLLLPGETLNRRRVAGLGVAIIGVAVLMFSGDSGLAVGGRPVLAIAWSLPGVASFSYSTVYAKRHAASLVGFEVLIVQFTVAAVLMLGPMLIVEGLPRLAPAAWGILAYLAIGSTVVPIMLFYWVLQRNSAAQTALVGYIVPLVAVVAGVILLSEQVGAGLIAGGLAIMTGVVIADHGGRRPGVLPA